MSTRYLHNMAGALDRRSLRLVRHVRNHQAPKITDVLWVGGALSAVVLFGLGLYQVSV
jgi:hypothetical protein